MGVKIGEGMDLTQKNEKEENDSRETGAKKFHRVRLKRD